MVKELGQIADQTEQEHWRDFMRVVPRAVISKFLPTATGRGTLEEAIRNFEALASQTYEGHPVVAALGITGSVGHGSIRLRELWRNDFSRIISTV